MRQQPESVRDVSVADVHKAGTLAAHLTRTQDGVEFRYVDGYHGPPVATTLRVSLEALLRPGGAPPAFFTGLLPEGRRLGALRRAVKTSVADELSLLLAVGADTIGDVRVVPQGQDRPPPRPRFVLDGSQVRFADALEGASCVQTGRGSRESRKRPAEDGCQVQGLQQPDGEWRVSPAYDVPSSKPDGDTTLAMSVNGRRSDVGARDIEALAAELGLPMKVAAGCCAPPSTGSTPGSRCSKSCRTTAAAAASSSGSSASGSAGSRPPRAADEPRPTDRKHPTNHTEQSTATARASQTWRIRASASRPNRETRTPSPTLSTESRFTADRRGTGSSPGSSTTSLTRADGRRARRDEGAPMSRDDDVPGQDHHRTPTDVLHLAPPQLTARRDARHDAATARRQEARSPHSSGSSNGCSS